MLYTDKWYYASQSKIGHMKVSKIMTKHSLNTVQLKLMSVNPISILYDFQDSNTCMVFICYSVIKLKF